MERYMDRYIPNGPVSPYYIYIFMKEMYSM